MSETYLDTLSWVKGKHQIKFGGQILRDQINKDTKFQQLIAFLGLGTSPGFFGSNTPFLIENIGNPTVGQRETMVNLFAQDDYQATPDLTLNIGLRYQYESAPAEAHGRNTNFNFATGKLFAPGTSVFDAPKGNFGPRLGFAWTPLHGRSFVVRGGYGIFYTSINPAVTQFEPANNPAYSYYRLVTIFDNPALTAFPATDISNGPVAGFFVPIPTDLKTPYTHSWNLNLQQGFRAVDSGASGLYRQRRPALRGIHGSQPDRSGDQEAPLSGLRIDAGIFPVLQHQLQRSAGHLETAARARVGF
ncbi:MAG: TonB-dependent receptor [Acidobacteriia bacterium]|nr:TonB-dependent receptor [Terriglobia bacterium]